MDLKWQDTEEIAIRLVEEHPETDPLTIRFTDMHGWIVALPEFKDDPEEIERENPGNDSDGLARGISRFDSHNRGGDKFPSPAGCPSGI